MGLCKYICIEHLFLIVIMFVVIDSFGLFALLLISKLLLLRIGEGSGVLVLEVG